ncbi:hypothetical protein [Flagellimonas beolgyonensis]|uniref:hypothetical protein n=1 Tax=Flagellimonas beolgyonensis TaxID=864064 RepID=UPI000F8DD59E|nr:hypothetical protein [Allomuricauda beolgyonensis]
MNRFVLIPLLVVAHSCAQTVTTNNKLVNLGKFPSTLKEVSGMETTQDGNLWVIEDSGNKDHIYKVNQKAEVLYSLKIDHAKNVDWEELTTDSLGNLYIGDFGNNANERKDLVIYKVDSLQLTKKEPNAKKIAFAYPEQKDFPPKKDSLYFDTEGMIHWQDHLYIFTKNRTRPYSGQTLVYRIPDEEGSYVAEFLGALFLCEDQNHCSVTSADISPDGKTIALLSYGKLFLLNSASPSNISEAKVRTIELHQMTQIESVCFLDNKTVIIADEQNRFGGRKLYKFQLD